MISQTGCQWILYFSADSSTSSPGFDLDAALHHLSGKSSTLHVSVFWGRMGRTCEITFGKLLGLVSVAVNQADAVSKTVVFQNGWVKLGSETDKQNLTMVPFAAISVWKAKNNSSGSNWAIPEIQSAKPPFIVVVEDTVSGACLRNLLDGFSLRLGG